MQQLYCQNPIIKKMLILILIIFCHQKELMNIYFYIISKVSCMLVKRQLDFNMGEKKYQKILDHCLALGNTLVFSGIKVHRKYCLTHVDQNGDILGEIIFDDQEVDSIKMVSDYELYGLMPYKNAVFYWDLRTHEHREIEFNFAVPYIYCSQLFVFPEAKIMAIQENGQLGNNTFRISYISQDYKNDQTIHEQFNDEDHNWTSDHTLITKGDNESMICWLKTKFSGSIDFCTYEFGKNGGFKKHVIKIEVNEQKDFQLNVAAMWRMREFEFCFICHSNRTKPDEDGFINNNYVINVKDLSMRETKFRFKDPLEQDLHLDQMNFGANAMIRTIRFLKGEALETPIYYIDNETQSIVAIETWKCSYLHKYHLPGYEPNLLVEGIYENGNVSHVKLLVKEIMEPKVITLFFLDEMIENCDEDLFYDVSEIIDYSL